MPGLAQLFAGFFVVGISGFGGVMPWARRMVVEQRRWLSEDEFVDALSMCQLVPGPNIVNFAVGLGGRFHGVPGAVACVTGLLAAPMVLVVGASLLLERFGDRPAVSGALHGMAAVAVALVVTMGVKVAGPLWRRRDWPGMAMAAVAFAAIAMLRLPLLPSLLALAPVSVMLTRFARRRG